MNVARMAMGLVAASVFALAACTSEAPSEEQEAVVTTVATDAVQEQGKTNPPPATNDGRWCISECRLYATAADCKANCLDGLCGSSTVRFCP